MAEFVGLRRSARIRNRRFRDRDWGNVGLESLRSDLHDSVDLSTDPTGVLTVEKKLFVVGSSETDDDVNR